MSGHHISDGAGDTQDSCSPVLGLSLFSVMAEFSPVWNL